jgi:G3E family GTPase/AcrR family transcriptional regulator
MVTFVPLGGFLGAGKTTTLLAMAGQLTKAGRRVAVVTNDQGDDLVDTRLAKEAIGRVAEVTGGCFCCRFDELADVVTALVAEGADTVLAEAVGSCTDLRATVVRPLRRHFGDRLDVAPLAVLVDPWRYRLFARGWDTGAESDLGYLYAHQLAEADVIAVNKVDTVSDERHLAAMLSDISARNPSARVLTCTAVSGGITDLLSAIGLPAADQAQDAPLDYDRYAAAEASLAWLNQAVTLTTEGPTGFDPARWAVTALAALSRACDAADVLIGHAKLTLETPDGLVKAALTEAGAAPRLDLPGPIRAETGLAVVNARLVCSPADLDRTVASSIAAANDACGTTSAASPGTPAFRPAYPKPTHRISAPDGFGLMVSERGRLGGMARPREFDEGRAVEAAMRAFWDGGYEGTSTQELCEVTGLNRSSIYNTFTSKHELFTLALRRYTETVTGAQVELLEGEGAVREKVRTLLGQVIDDECGDRLGCLVVNTAVELARHDAEVAEQLRLDYGRRIDALRGAIDVGRGRGEISADTDSVVLAHFVAAQVSGLRLAARAGADRVALEGIAATALGVF